MNVMKLYKNLNSKINNINFLTLINSSKFSTTTNSNGKIAELRQYSVKPEKAGQLQKLFTKYMDTRKKYSKPLGFWQAEFGTAINKQVSIWEYESLSERAEIRKSLVNDDVWANEFLPAAMECLSVQENCTMLETNWSKDLACTDLKGNGIYELSTLNLTNGTPQKWSSTLHQFIESALKTSSCQLIGAWHSDSGNANEAYILWRFNSYECRSNAKMLIGKEEIMKNMNEICSKRHSMILLPCKWSPLQ